MHEWAVGHKRARCLEGLKARFGGGLTADRLTSNMNRRGSPFSPVDSALNTLSNDLLERRRCSVIDWLLNIVWRQWPTRLTQKVLGVTSRG